MPECCVKWQLRWCLFCLALVFFHFNPPTPASRSLDPLDSNRLSDLSRPLILFSFHSKFLFIFRFSLSAFLIESDRPQRAQSAAGAELIRARLRVSTCPGDTRRTFPARRGKEKESEQPTY